MSLSDHGKYCHSNTVPHVADWFPLAWDPQQKVTTWSQGMESHIEKYHVKAGKQTSYDKDAKGVAFEG